jgi:hypothetical protein
VGLRDGLEPDDSTWKRELSRASWHRAERTDRTVDQPVLL